MGESNYITACKTLRFGVEVDAYLACALWCAQGEDGAQVGRPWAYEAIAQARDTVAEFVARNARDCALWVEEFGDGQVGHDLYLTQNHGGAGFWDRDYSGGPVTEAGRRLTEAAGPGR